MKKETSETCHQALIEYQQKYGVDALTENETLFLYGVITYEQFKRRVSTPQDSLFEILGIEKAEFVQEFRQRI